MGNTEEKDRENDSLVGGFRGHAEYVVDDKGRVSLPAEFRKSLVEAKLVITNYISDGARCLEGYTIVAWRAFEHKLASKSRFDAKLQKLENYYISRACQCELDSAGRILLPPHLRTYAGIEKNVVLTASINGFRIWDKRAWDLIFAQAEAAILENPNTFSEIDI